MFSNLRAFLYNGCILKRCYSFYFVFVFNFLTFNGHKSLNYKNSNLKTNFTGQKLLKNAAI